MSAEAWSTRVHAGFTMSFILISRIIFNPRSHDTYERIFGLQMDNYSLTKNAHGQRAWPYVPWPFDSHYCVPDGNCKNITENAVFMRFMMSRWLALYNNKL